ncbi:hypothetical protein [Streptomyces sp. AK08-02]|uniref:hypothetical protein n=1 Tax=Streptomyces sp. AK08-02 TaxID=3028654 RepID=UPI0029A71039|nr:hypothetical protein [Streptomyces sp. AK08-02]MDX3752737.1 hypothetical protein [Streptomyces sp. AK08-02]
MSGEHGSPYGQAQDVRGGQNQVNIQSGGATTIGPGAVVAGGDVTIVQKIQKIQRWAFANPLFAGGLAVVVLSGTIWTGISLGAGDAVDRSVVDEAGLDGARHTVEQIRVAERIGDAASWCYLTQPGDGTCETGMSAAFAAKSASYRERVDEVGVGETEKTDSGVQTVLSWDGREQGTVRLVRSGGRWQLNSSDYGLLKVCDAGVFLSLVDARSQQLKCGMFQIPTS